jgi:hypothetical protein
MRTRVLPSEVDATLLSKMCVIQAAEEGGAWEFVDNEE